MVGADEERLRQVLINLVRNGLQAVEGREHGWVRVALEPWGAGARLLVEDNGPGVAPDIATRIFEPFFTTKDTGTGLGMAIAHRIIDLHGGTLELLGGAGAAFEVTLPRQPPQPL